MFVRFACGCVGITDNYPMNTTAIILKPCDEDRESPRDSLTWGSRDMSTNGPAEPLVAHSEAMLHQQIRQRFGRADRFDTVTAALGVKE